MALFAPSSESRHIRDLFPGITVQGYYVPDSVRTKILELKEKYKWHNVCWDGDFRERWLDIYETASGPRSYISVTGETRFDATIASDGVFKALTALKAENDAAHAAKVNAGTVVTPSPGSSSS